MTEKDLRDHILLVMLNYRDKNNNDIDDFCSKNNIIFSSDEQKERIFHYLNKMGYIKTTFFMGGNGIFSVTSTGIDYAENLLSKSLQETDQKVKEHSIQLDLDNEKVQENRSTNKLQNNDYIKLYVPIENNKKIIDNSIDACFGVKQLAQCFVNLINLASGNTENNVCMIGIFAPWGRGKSYFFHKVKDIIKDKNKSSEMDYDVVEFNAWKYQETPATWAYLYEILYKDKSCLFKFNYTLCHNWKSIVSNVLIILTPLIITLIGNFSCNWLNVSIGVSTTGLAINFLRKHYNSAISFIRKYSKGVSFSNELGIQAEIEKEITSLLKFWISDKKTDKKKVLLYVDDIDRCSEIKMISIIDSLRTVLENEAIRKRLIVVCSIDPEKIIKGIEYKYGNLYENNELHTIAIEQMDKIFLTGIALPPLDNIQLYEFVSKLTEIENKDITDNVQQANTPYSINRAIGAFVATNENGNTQLKLNKEEIDKELKRLIDLTSIKLTPRKIRVIYYRILLASDIICINKNSKMPSNIIKDIFDLSIGVITNSDMNESALNDVVNMVVPYKTNEYGK